MITWLKTWANQIIVALIIATILEMILPEGNNKKYIKMIIGIYVLFTIISPIITKLTGNNFNIEDFKYNKYFKDTVSISSNSEEKFDDNNSKLIEQSYIDSIKKDLNTKIIQKGYEIIECNISVLNKENETYGTINNINLKLKKIEEKKSSDNSIIINNININIENNTKADKVNSNISEKEKNTIIDYISSEYSIKKEYIHIN